MNFCQIKIFNSAKSNFSPEKVLKMPRPKTQNLSFAGADNKSCCEVCLVVKTKGGDRLMVCGRCNGIVHQKCYGFELEFETQEKKATQTWYCYRCKIEILNQNKSEKYSCHFCGGQNGVMGNYTFQERKGKQRLGNFMAHGLCVRWFPDFQMQIEYLFSKKLNLIMYIHSVTV